MVTQFAHNNNVWHVNMLNNYGKLLFVVSTQTQFARLHITGLYWLWQSFLSEFAYKCVYIVVLYDLTNSQCCRGVGAVAPLSFVKFWNELLIETGDWDQTTGVCACLNRIKPNNNFFPQEKYCKSMNIFHLQVKLKYCWSCFFLEPSILGLVTALQVNLYIGNTLSKLSGKFETKLTYVED